MISVDQHPSANPIRELNAALVEQAIAAGSPSKLIALLDSIRQSGPVEAVQYAPAREALCHLWACLQARSDLAAYRRARRTVTLASYRDLLDDLEGALVNRREEASVNE